MLLILQYKQLQGNFVRGQRNLIVTLSAVRSMYIVGLLYYFKFYSIPKLALSIFGYRSTQLDYAEPLVAITDCNIILQPPIMPYNNCIKNINKNSL